MKKIQTLSSRTVPYPAEKVWEVVTDIPRYGTWWPSSIRITTLNASEDIIGSRIEVRPYGGLPFICEVVALNRFTELTMNYSGAYVGSGRWTIQEDGGQSTVTYEITLEIRNRFIRLVSLFLPVARIHDRLMESILAGLSRHLEK